MILENALKIIHRLSDVSKMPCYSYATSAWHCKRGSKLKKIPGSVCNKCYAMRGNFCRPTIQAILMAREVAMTGPLWAEAMVIVLKAYEQSGYFRWFASGDLQSLGDLLKICYVAEHTPRIKHWLPTHEVEILAEFKRGGFNYPPNLIVRLSGDMIDKKPSPGLSKRLGVLRSSVSRVAWNCEAPQNEETKCMSCRKCWHKSVSIITYKYH